MPHVRHLRKCEDRDVVVYVPSGGKGPFPILVFLHDAGEAAQHEDGRAQPPEIIENHGPPAAARDRPDAAHWPSIAEARKALQPFLIICPQRDKYGQWTARDAEWVIDAVHEAEREFNGDATRRLLTGMGFGGLGVLRFATGKLRDEWAAFWAVDPNPELSPARGRFLLHHGLKFAGGDTKGYRKGINPNLKDIFDLKRQAKEWWSLPGSEQAYLELKLDHLPACQAAYADPDAYQWLLNPGAGAGAAASPAAAAPQPAPAAAAKADPVRAAVEDGNRKFCAAIGAKDFGAVAALYTENAKLLPPDAPVISGRKAIEEFWGAAAAKLGVTGVTLTTADLDVAGDTACEVGEAALALASGTTKVKYLVVWRKDGGTWRLHRDMWNTAG